MTEEAFEQLPIPRKHPAASAASRYRVYTDGDHYELVEAGSALEALQVSKHKQARRIVRDALSLDNVLKPAKLSDLAAIPLPPAAKVSAITPAPPEEKPAEPPLAPLAPNEPPAAAESLSGDEVDKLLKSG